MSNLETISARLKEAVERIPGEPSNAEEEYARWEEISILTVDSEHENYPEGVLYEYLLAYLEEKRRELGLEPFGEK